MNYVLFKYSRILEYLNQTLNVYIVYYIATKVNHEGRY